VRDLLWVLYLLAKQCVSSVSAHSFCVSVSHFRLLKWETSTFISLGLWLQHPHLNPLKYKIGIKIQQWVFLRKIHNVNWPTLWYGWHGFEQRIIDNATDEWCKRICVCVHVKERLSLYSVWLQIWHFLHFNVLVWWKLQVSGCYCVEYIRFLPFFIVYFSPGSVATYLRCGGKNDKYFIANSLLNPKVKEL